MPVDDDVKSLEYLMDVITQVPLLLQRSNEMINSKTVHLEHLSALLIAFRQIMTWQQWCKRSSTTPLYWAVPSNIHNPADDGYPSQLFPFSIEYEGLNVAMLFVFSSAVMLQLLSAAHLLITTNDVLSDKINKLASTERARPTESLVSCVRAPNTAFGTKWAPWDHKLCAIHSLRCATTFVRLERRENSSGARILKTSMVMVSAAV
jgi:hypothetical protein